MLERWQSGVVGREQSKSSGVVVDDGGVEDWSLEGRRDSGAWWEDVVESTQKPPLVTKLFREGNGLVSGMETLRRNRVLRVPELSHQ